MLRYCFRISKKGRILYFFIHLSAHLIHKLHYFVNECQEELQPAYVFERRNLPPPTFDEIAAVASRSVGCIQIHFDSFKLTQSIILQNE